MLCEVRIYVRSAMVERRYSLWGPQRQLREHVRSAFGQILNPSFSRDSRLLTLHITKVQTTMTGCRSCAAMKDHAFHFLEAVFRKTEAFSVSFPNRSRRKCWLFRLKRGPTRSVSY